MNKSLITVAFCLLLFACKDKQDEKKGNANLPAVIAGLQTQIAQKPDSIGLHIQLIDALDSLGNYKQAIIETDALIKKDSMNYAFWFRRGQLCSSAKDTTSAILSYSKAIKIYAAPDAFLALANLYAETKNAQSLLLTDYVLRLRMGRENNAHCFFIKGIYYARTNDKIKAIQYFDQCVAENYTYTEAYLEKGFILFDSNKTEEALKTFQLAANINSTNADAYYWIAKCNEAMHKKEEAIKNYQTALQLDANLQEAKDALKRLQ